VKLTDGDDGSTLPYGTVVRDWGVLTYGTIGGEPIYANANFWFDNSTQILYWTHFNGYFADPCTTFPEVLATRFNSNGTLTNVGFWSFSTDLPSYKSFWGGVTKLSTSFAQTYTGGREMALGFGGYYSVCQAASRGPALAAIARPVAGEPLDILPIMYYPERNPSVRDGLYIPVVGFWDDTPASIWEGKWAYDDYAKSGVFIDLPDKKGYLSLTNQVIGRVGYDYGGYNADGHWENNWYFYKLDDLGEAALGHITPYDIKPASISLAPYPTIASADTMPSGSCFDETTRLLYIYILRAFTNKKPVIHVYHLKEDAAATTPAAPTDLRLR
jgi:hypothetical protein